MKDTVATSDIVPLTLPGGSNYLFTSTSLLKTSKLHHLALDNMSKNYLMHIFGWSVFTEWHLHKHGRGPASLRGHDQDGQDLQGPLHIRHLVQEHHLRNDAHPGSGYDLHHQRSRGPGTKDQHSRRQVKILLKLKLSSN